jgi:hypothetical protein
MGLRSTLLDEERRAKAAYEHHISFHHCLTADNAQSCSNRVRLWSQFRAAQRAVDKYRARHVEERGKLLKLHHRSLD